MSTKLFTKYQTGKMSGAEINKAYSNLRKIANKRLQRLQAQNLGRSAREGFRFPTIKEINGSSRWNVESKLLEVSQFLRSERTTVTGEKRFIADFVSNMESMGYGDLVTNLDDIYNMLEYMEYLREQYGNKLFDSGDALDVLQQAQRLNIPIDKVTKNYDLFASNLNKMEKLKPSKSGVEFSQRRINNLIKKWQ